MLRRLFRSHKDTDSEPSPSARHGNTVQPAATPPDGLAVNFASPANTKFQSAKIYRALDTARKEIRLIRVLPGKPHEKIKCKLVQNISLTEVRSQRLDGDELFYANARLFEDSSGKVVPPGLDYIALSYCAGKVTDTEVIKLQGIDFVVFANLAEALRRFRRTWCSVQVWVDQACINQEDAEERESQVAMMAEIYGASRLVWVWLGYQYEVNDPESNEAANTLITTLCKAEAYPRSSGNDPEPELEKEASRQIEEHLSGYTPYELCSALIWAKAPWWRRCWVLQEVGLAREVYFSYSHNSNFHKDRMWYAYFGLMKALSGRIPKEHTAIMREILPDLQTVMTVIQRNFFQAQPQFPFEEVLSLARSQLSSDPRDRVYSMLGFLRAQSRITPNYSLPVSVTFAYAVKACVEESLNLDVLALVVRGSPNPTSNLPSWVPDFTRDADQSYLLSGNETRPIQGDLWWDDPGHKAVFSIDDTAISSATLDCTALMLSQLADSAYFSDIKQCKCLVAGIHDPYRFERETTDTTFAEACQQSNVHYQQLGRLSQEQKKTLFEAILAEREDECSAFFLSLGYWRIFITPQGYPGIASAETRHDDQLVLLLDANTPFVIRKLNESKDAEHDYTLIGPAYIYGLDILQQLQNAHVGTLTNLQRIRLV